MKIHKLLISGFLVILSAGGPGYLDGLRIYQVDLGERSSLIYTGFMQFCNAIWRLPRFLDRPEIHAHCNISVLGHDLGEFMDLNMEWTSFDRIERSRYLFYTYLPGNHLICFTICNNGRGNVGFYIFNGMQIQTLKGVQNDFKKNFIHHLAAFDSIRLLWREMPNTLEEAVQYAIA